MLQLSSPGLTPTCTRSSSSVSPRQLDDMLQGTSFPVMTVPGDASVLQDPTAEPLIFYTQVRSRVCV